MFGSFSITGTMRCRLLAIKNTKIKIPVRASLHAKRNEGSLKIKSKFRITSYNVCYTKLLRDLHDVMDRFRIVGVDMENRRVDHLGDRGAIQRGTRVQLVAGSETDLVSYNFV